MVKLRRHLAAVWALCGIFLFAGVVQAQDALPFAKSYTVTGNYVVGGVHLPNQSADGFATRIIPMRGVPENADILAAFLYWETISTDVSQLKGATFRGEPITAIKAASKKISPPVAA